MGLTTFCNSILILGGLLFIYTIFGRILERVLKLQVNTSCFTCVVGLLFYECIFFCIAFPIGITSGKLSLITKIWCLLILIFIIWECWKTQISFKNEHRKFLNNIFMNHSKKEFFIVLFIAIIVLFQCYLAVYNAAMGADAAYHTSTISTSIYTDTIWRYDAYTGQARENLSIKRVFTTASVESAVICSITTQEPIIYMRFVECSRMIVVTNMLYCMYADKFLGKSAIKRLQLIMCMCIINIVYQTGYTSSTFMFFRGSEPKALCAAFLIPVCGYMCHEVITSKYEDKKMWLILFITNLGAATMSGTAMMLVPVFTIIILGTQAFFEKHTFKQLFKVGLSVSPSLIMAMMYIVFELFDYKIPL